MDKTTLIAAQSAAKAQLDQTKQQEMSSAINILPTTAQLIIVTAAQAEAQRDFDRHTALAKAGTISTATMDLVHSAQAGVNGARAQHRADVSLNGGGRAAKANLALANIILAYAYVIAPTSGWISKIDL